MSENMKPLDEAQLVWRNLKADPEKIAHYVMGRCGEFTYDHEREEFIAAFLSVPVLIGIARQSANAETDLAGGDRPS